MGHSRTWVPLPSEDHILWDVIMEHGQVIGSVERFDEGAPCYAWADDIRLGAFTDDAGARLAVLRPLDKGKDALRAELTRRFGGYMEGYWR